MRDLSSRVGTPPARLRDIGRNIGTHYTTRPLVQGKKARQLAVPTPELKEIQRRINSNILAKIKLLPCVYGGVPGGSPRKNAAQHVDQLCVVNMDVKEFFPHVRHYMVYRMFKHELRFGRDVASLLTRLTTYRSYLPQGAPTSTPIANLLLAAPVDASVAAEATRLGLHYSRFVDDIAISGKNPRRLINFIAKLLSRRRLQIHRFRRHIKSKLKITSSGRAQQVTGLIVNAPSGLSVPGERRDEIRTAIWILRRTNRQDLFRAVNSIRGKISYVAQFNRGSAKRLTAYLEATLTGRSSGITSRSR
jgi:RNA-directed DNA polymerase